jgi:spore coat protein CotH
MNQTFNQIGRRSGTLYRSGFAIAATAVSIAIGCTDSGVEPRKTTDPPAITAPAAPDATDAGPWSDNCGGAHLPALDGDVEDLFGFPHVPTFDLYLPEAEWLQLQVNAREERYVEADACFEGGSVGKVGLRFKGSYGSLFTCFSDEGENTCRKLGLKLKFDKFEPEQRFYGLKRLNLQSNRYDDSYLKEKLAYDLYRSMGVPAPHAGWAVVRVNGEVEGLFGMVEAIDGRYTANRWPDDGDGNLFKEVWPVETDPERISEALKTNTAGPDITAFIAFAEAMNSAPERELRTTLGQYADLEALARYMAVDDAIVNVDGVTAYYTDDAEWSSNHNFYIYEHADQRFTLIPWDLDSTFETNSFFGSVPHWTQKPDDCDSVYRVWGGESLALAPGCSRVFQAIAANLTGYRAAGQELLDGPFAEQAMLRAIEKHTTLIEQAAATDPNGPGEEGWRNAVDALRRRLPALRDRFERVLSGEPWIAQALNTTETTTFETQDDFGLAQGTLLVANPASTVSVGINTSEPLVGERDVKLLFEYGNEPAPWEQWSLFDIPLVTGQNDLSSLVGIRLWVRADQQRSLRFSLNSPESSRREEGILFGWDVRVDGSATPIEVLFTDMAHPSWAVSQSIAPEDDPARILANVTGLRFYPEPVGRGSSGFFDEGTTDKGFLQLDDIEFF